MERETQSTHQSKIVSTKQRLESSAVVVVSRIWHGTADAHYCHRKRHYGKRKIEVDILTSSSKLFGSTERQSRVGMTVLDKLLVQRNISLTVFTCRMGRIYWSSWADLTSTKSLRWLLRRWLLRRRWWWKGLSITGRLVLSFRRSVMVRWLWLLIDGRSMSSSRQFGMIKWRRRFSSKSLSKLSVIMRGWWFSITSSDAMPRWNDGGGMMTMGPESSSLDDDKPPIRSSMWLRKVVEA